MYAKDIKVGMKVVPVIRTTDEGPLSTSEEWEKNKDKGFLWVIKVIEEPGKRPQFECAGTKSAKSGDVFNTIDLRAYPWNGWESRKKSENAPKKTTSKKTTPKKTTAKKPAKKAPARKAPAKKRASRSRSRARARKAEPIVDPVDVDFPPE